MVRPLFDRLYPSFELGVAKPDPTIFKLVLDDLDLAPEEVVFLDDHQINVDAAESVGITARCVSSPQEARRQLAQLPGLQHLPLR